MKDIEKILNSTGNITIVGTKIGSFATNDYSVVSSSDCFFYFLVCPQHNGNRFSCRHENVSGSMNDNRMELEQVVHTHSTSHQSGRLAGRPVWCTKSQSPLLTFTFISVGPSPCSPLLIWLEKLFTLRQKVAEIYTICDIHFSKSAAAQFLSLTEMAGKSPFFYMSWQKQNPVLFSCRCKGYLIIAFRVSHTPAINLPHNSVATIQCYERFNRLG